MASNILITLIRGTSITEPKWHVLFEGITLPVSLEPLVYVWAPNPGTCSWTHGSGVNSSLGPTKLFWVGRIAGPCRCCAWEADVSSLTSNMRDVVLRLREAGEEVRFVFGPIWKQLSLTVFSKLNTVGAKQSYYSLFLLHSHEVSENIAYVMSPLFRWNWKKKKNIAVKFYSEVLVYNHTLYYGKYFIFCNHTDTIWFSNAAGKAH